jgi:uncharacterized membrane protein YhaH (DUF805 family)
MYCAQCGKPIAPGSKFCPFCGALADNVPNEIFPKENMFHSQRKSAATRNIFENFVHVFQNFANFGGRASRAEFWYFFLANFVLGAIFSFFSEELYLLYGLVSIVPNLSLQVRRLHDVGKSGWWLLICLTIIGVFYILYLSCLAGDEDTNVYGPNPYSA